MDGNVVTAGLPVDPTPVLVQLSQIRLSEHSLEDVLAKIASMACAALPGTEEASVTLLHDARGHTAAHTGQLALAGEELQHAQGYGPCLDAAASTIPVIVSDMRTEDRWPEYAPLAARAGIRSSVSIPLPVQVDVSGSLNLYSRKPETFTPDFLPVAIQFASFAAVAIANARDYANSTALAFHMQEAMKSRAVIEQAKGILMALHGCHEDAAFTMLSRASQRENRKLREVAADIVAKATRRG